MSDLNNRRVAKNAILLSARMIVVAVVGLYTSRVVLNALGVEDYGIYGLVGGVVGMVSFLNGAMGGATSRFITYEIGTGDYGNLRKVFSTSFLIHLCITALAVVIMETLGLWFLHHKLVIPPEKMFAANIVFQLSIISMAVSFTQVPYSAIIIAHEKMNIYAYFEIVNVILKLVIVYILIIANTNKLIIYAVLMLMISLATALFYRWYCIRHFKESVISYKIDISYAKRMLTFSGYDLYGNMSVMVYLQGLPIVLNLFLGVVATAASNIGTTVTGTVKGFSWAVSSAFIPQITIQYAAGNIRNMESVMKRSIMFTTLTFAICALPFFVETERVLYLWLGQIPEYSVAFMRMIMIVTLVDYLTMSNNRGIHATGNIKWISLISGSFYLICPFIAYLFMKLGGPSYSPYLVNVIMLSIVSVIGFNRLKKQIPEYNIHSYVYLILRTFAVIIISGFVLELLSRLIIGNHYPVYETSFWSSVLIVVCTLLAGAILLGVLSYCFVFDIAERLFIKNKVAQYIKKIQKC